jgi:hypothetical protein
MASPIVKRIVSAAWLGILFLCVAWPITIPAIWSVAAAFLIAGYRFPRGVLLVGLTLTCLGVSLIITEIRQQVRIDSASSCATQGDASVMSSRASIVSGPRDVAVVRSEVCAYQFAQGGVVDYVFLARSNNLNRRSLVLRYTSNNADYSMANPPHVRWSPNRLHVVVPKGSMYALTYRENRVYDIDIDYDMRPEEDDSFVPGQIWSVAARANILDLLL